MPRKITHFSLLSLLFLALFMAIAQPSVAAQAIDTERALFWKIEKDGQTRGYLLGTIHSEDPRVLDFSEEFSVLLKANDIFAMEMVPDLPTLARLTEYMHYPEGQNLQSVIGIERFEALKTALSGYSVPIEFINRMKPWAAMMTLSTPPPVTGFFMDLSLSLRASGSGLKVVGLETLEQQLSFLEDMPEDMQLSLLDQAIADFDKVKQVHDEMVAIYLGGDLVKLQEVSYEQMQEAGVETRDYFIQSGINDRNMRMLETLETQLQQGRVFAAVGALHLTGSAGLINLLRDQGYTLEPLPIPLAVSAEQP
jgi:hypothetical protein